MIAIAFASPPASPAIALVGSPGPRVTGVGRKLRLQDRLWKQHCRPHTTRCANIHNLVLIWREQPLAFGEGGRDHPLTLDPGPHIDEAILLGVVDKRLLVCEFPLRHPPSAALPTAPGTKLNFARFTFPKYDDQSSRRQYPGMTMPDRNSKPANSRTVLVLDDDVLVRMPVVQFLRDCGYRVVEAASTDEAIVILQKTNIPVDVVMSEIDIPGSMNGFGFAQWARSVRPELKILLAGTPERTVQNAAELCEVGPTLKRPYGHKLVLDRIKRLLAARAQQGGR